MTTGAKSGFKTQMQYGDGAIVPAEEAFTTLAEVTEIDPPEAAADQIEVTSHDSTVAEFISAYIDEGEISLKANFLNDATDIAARGKLGGALANWQLCFPNWGARVATFTINAGTDTIISVAHGLTTGQPFQASSSVTLPTPLVAGTTYYAGRVDADTIKAYATNAGAVAGAGALDLADGEGTFTLQIGTRLSFAANVSGHKIESPIKGQIAMSLKAKLTGAATLA